MLKLDVPRRSSERTPLADPAIFTPVTPPSHFCALRPPTGLRLVIEHTIVCVFGVLPDDLQVTRRGPAHVALARQTAMYLAHTSCELSLTEVGTLFERDRTTVAHACALIEDRRDDINFDRVLQLLDRAIIALRFPRVSQ